MDKQWCPVCAVTLLEEKENIKCTGKCQKQFHFRCVKPSNTNQTTNNWKCVECLLITGGKDEPSSNVELHKTKNPWIPHHKEENENSNKSNANKLYCEVRSILNKITPQKFSILLHTMKTLCISTVDHLDMVVRLVFEKAVKEPYYSALYAELCMEMQRKTVHTKGKSSAKFRNLILAKSQKEFELDVQFQELNEEEYSAIKKRKLGNIRFMCELFRMRMLDESIMENCIIQKLLSAKNELCFECIACLLTNIGELLEGIHTGDSFENIVKKRDLMRANVAQIQKIIDKRQTSTRIRFMLQDVLEMRNRNWGPRRVTDTPKTLSEIHTEFCKSEHKTAAGLMTADTVKLQSLDLYATNFAYDEDYTKKSSSAPKVTVVKLHHSNNAWKPSHKIILKDTEDFKQLELLRKAKSVLNKVTPTKLIVLVHQVEKLEINTEDDMSQFVDLLFENAICSPKYAAVYASLCTELCNLAGPNSEESIYAEFRGFLLKKCHIEFEISRKRALTEQEDEITDEEAHRNFKRRFLGNVRFMGELFKSGIIQEDTILSHIQSLLTEYNDLSLECLCCLLRVTGKMLSENQTEKIVTELERIMESYETNLRMKFMLLDSIELQKRQWVPRIREETPKTIEEIRQQVL